MQIQEAITEILSRDLSKPLTRDELHAVAGRCGSPPSEVYNALLIEVSLRFLRGHLSFSQADAVANDVWVAIVSDMGALGDAFEMPEPAYSIYEAFDAGEYPHGDGLDPVEAYTRPELRRLIE